LKRRLQIDEEKRARAVTSENIPSEKKKSETGEGWTNRRTDLQTKKGKVRLYVENFGERNG
jgi:hypothetical protein